MESCGKADVAKETTEEKTAKEKLELELEALAVDKHTHKEGYNKDDYINDWLEKKEMIVIENTDIVSVDGWKFEIDRTVPKIKSSLGRGELEEQITIGITTPAINEDYTVAKITIEISYEKDIAQIAINGEKIDVPQKQERKYVIEKTVEQNGKYTIWVKDKDEKFNIATVEVKEITEDMDIYTVDDLVVFRNNVNSGRTYKERTVRVMSDIDLSTVCGETIGSWEPIANYEVDQTHKFKGTFQGNNHKIDNLYINNSNNYQGLFGFIEDGTITDVIINKIEGKETDIKANARVGAIAGHSQNSTIQNCENNVAIAGSQYVGGIIGFNRGTIEKCTNKGEIKGIGSSSLGYVGGISGVSYGTVEKCNNIKDISSNGYAVGGISGANYSGKIVNCYSIGEISSLGCDTSGNSCTGGIVGANSSNATVENVYHIGNVSAKYTYVGGIVGYNGNSSAGTQIVKNVFNEGTISCGTQKATTDIGSGLGTLIGRYGKLTGQYKNLTKGEMKKWQEEINTYLGECFTKDINNINEGYPIIK